MQWELALAQTPGGSSVDFRHPQVFDFCNKTLLLPNARLLIVMEPDQAGRPSSLSSMRSRASYFKL